MHDLSTQEKFIITLFKKKYSDPTFTWKDFLEEAQTVLGTSAYPRELSERSWRRRYNNWVTETAQKEDEEPSNQEVYMQELIREFKVVRAQIADERSQNNAYIRKISRENTLLQIASDFANKMNSKKVLKPTYQPLSVNSQGEGILCLSDWHYGMDFSNHLNAYSPKMCAIRLQKLQEEVIRRGKMFGIRKLHVLNLGDLIAGRIHLTIRLESRYDVVTQTMKVAELLAELLTNLSEHFEIEYRDTLDNHSRLEPNKKDSMELETLARIIPWFLETRLIDNNRIKILYNEFADDLVSFKVYDWQVGGVHGHKDKPTQVVKNIAAITYKRHDLVLSAHYHHFAGEEENETIRLSNGTLMGVDTHSLDLRLTSKPSQLFIVATPNNVIDYISKINL